MKKKLTICVLALLAFQSLTRGQTSSATGRLINLSTRGFVGIGDSAMVVGFVISEGDYFVLARAIGPSLAPLGVSTVLAQPTMEIVDSQGYVVASNLTGGGISLDLRFSDVAPIAQKVGAFPISSSSRDCSIYLRLRRGTYTMIVRGAGNSTGNVLAEIYGVPESFVNVQPSNP